MDKRMGVVFCVGLLLFFQAQGEKISHVEDGQCPHLVYKYSYTSKSIFHYVPSTIINQTTLNIRADVHYYQSKAPCNQSFIQFHNLTIDPYENTTLHTDTKQLERSLLEIFTQTSNSTQDIISSDDYENTTIQYRRIKILRTNNGRFIGNSIFGNYLLNKLFSPTKTTCENIINLSEEKLENSLCHSTTAGLITVHREINFVSQIDQQIFPVNPENVPSIERKRQRNKDDFDRLLREICSKNSAHQLSEIMNNELSDEDLKQILSSNTKQYSLCEWTAIMQNIIQVTRPPATEYIFKTFSSDESMIEYHFDLIEQQSTNPFKEIFKKHLNDSCQISSVITLRMLIFIAEDNLTIQCVLNENNHWKSRAMALRVLNKPNDFHIQLRKIMHDEQEAPELRILAFQHLSPDLNLSEMNHLIETVQSNQLRLYIKSLFKQSSIWFGNSGSYEFPFGQINIIFNEQPLSLIPNVMQVQLANNTLIDMYYTPNSEILVLFGRRSILRFSTINDFFKWLNNDRSFRIETLDGFSLQINLKTDFQPFKNLFEKSTAGIVLQIQHGLGGVLTGYEINLNVQSNFKIIIHRFESSTSYIWRSQQKENILFKIEQLINPSIGHQLPLSNHIPSSSNKDFCYIIPHFDSKICLSFLFERLWPSSIAIRLLADDPSLIYNLTTSTDALRFNIQQNEQTFRSYRLLRVYNEHSSWPNHLEFSTPTTNYTSVIHWKNESMILFDLLKNNRSIANGSGVYRYDLAKRLSINLTAINPNDIGEIFIDYNGNLTIIAPKLLGGELTIQIDRFFGWKQAHIRVEVERMFFFLKQKFLVHCSYDINRPTLNFTFIRNENSLFQWMLMKNQSAVNHLLIVNTSLLDINHHTQGFYFNTSNMAIQSSLLMNGWSFWNISAMINNGEQVQIRVNGLFLNAQMDNRTMQMEVDYFNHQLLRSYLYRNQSNRIDFLVNIGGYRYESEGKLSANYTNFSLDFPIIENQKRKSRIYFQFSSLPDHLICNFTSNLRKHYFLTSLFNLTFRNNYIYQSEIQTSLTMIHYPLVSFHSFAQYLENSTVLQLLNGSLILPSLFFSQPLLFHYQKNSQLFLQFFQWTTVTRSAKNYHISTLFGLQLLIKNDLPSRISVDIEQTILSKRYSLILEIDRSWMISLVLNRKIRYEFISAPIDSIILIKRIHLSTNQTRQLPIKYHTDNQTLIRIEISFSQYFTTLINDFILDISLKNQTLKFFCHVPFFKREFFALTWKRYPQEEFFHFHGLIETRFLRRRRLMDYEYNYNLASIRFWTFNSQFILFSFDPIQWNLNLTNDYLWDGKWAMNFRLMLAHRRELIRLDHKYQYKTFASNLLFHLHLINSNYDLDFDYYHFNHSIAGIFIKNRYEHQINGYWNRTEDSLQLNTQHMQSVTTITSTLFKSFVERDGRKTGILLERMGRSSRNDTQILECNPYLIIRSYPRLFLLHYYTLNDGLSTMMLEWSTRSYLSWNYTGHSRIPFPLRKFEIDIRTKYIFRFHTATFKYSAIYNKKTRQLTIGREPIADDADDRYKLKLKLYHNQTFLIHLQVINNHYEIIGNPAEDDVHWDLRGYFQQNRFNGSLAISDTDWLLSSKLNFNSSLYISTGQYVQLIPTSDPQIAFEILSKSRLHLALQYSGLRSFTLLKFFHNSSNINLYFSSRSINQTIFHLNFQLNNLLNQTWILKIDERRFSLSNHNSEFVFNVSLKDFSFEHFIADRKNEFFINENTITFLTHKFHVILSNLSSDTTKYFHISHRPSQQNLTINYYKFGRFYKDDFNLQTPIYDINAIYYPSDDENRYVKVFFEFLPLQMSSFTLVRGRTFRIGYETKAKQCILAGNLAFGLEDIYNKDVLTMKERWKFIYGIEKREKLYIKWNMKINLNQKSLQGRVNLQDPNNDMSLPVYSDINAYLKETVFATDIHTVYSSVDKPIVLQINVDQRLRTQQFISVKLTHQSSQTNLSFTIDHHPRRQFLLRLKPNKFSTEVTLLHLYANTTESQLKLLLILAKYIHFNLTLPKSYPETGLLHSALFIENEEYFDGRLDTTALRFRTKDYLFNISLSQLLLQKRLDYTILASIFARWIERNSSTALITVFSQADFQRISMPIWQSAEQNTWLQRFQQFLFHNNLTGEFSADVEAFHNYLLTDLINEQGQFGVQLMNHLKLDENLHLGLQRINLTTLNLIETLFQISLSAENFFQEYLNNLSCLIHHRNLIHLDPSQLTILTIHSIAYDIVHYVNKTLTMLHHFTHYPRSINAVLSYISNELILKIYRFVNDLYLETKNYFLSKLIEYSHQMDLLVQIAPLLSDSITYFSSNNLRTIVYMINTQFRRLLSIWLNSPIEYKLMKTITSQLIELIDKLRFYLDDKLDFLLPTLKVYTPRFWLNNGVNQTFLLTWSKQYNFSNPIDEE